MLKNTIITILLITSISCGSEEEVAQEHFPQQLPISDLNYLPTNSDTSPDNSEGDNPNFARIQDVQTSSPTPSEEEPKGSKF